MQKGDLLVYGYEDKDGWHGHVAILVDSNFASHSYRGLLVGAHSKVGVRFVTVQGFPDYFRRPEITLRRVLRPVLESNV